MMISSNNFNNYSVLEKCLGFALKENVSKKLNFGKLCANFSPCINFIEKKLAKRVIPKVPVIACLYVNPTTCKCLEFFAAIVQLETGTCFKGIWSILIMSEAGMEYFSISVLLLYEHLQEFLVRW